MRRRADSRRRSRLRSRRLPAVAIDRARVQVDSHATERLSVVARLPVRIRSRKTRDRPHQRFTAAARVGGRCTRIACRSRCAHDSGRGKLARGAAIDVAVSLSMHAWATAGAGFLIAVLWFDLMFDTQTRRHRGAALPDDVLASIRAYYRRVTSDARPMNRLISVVMLGTLAAIAAELANAATPRWLVLVSLAAAVSAIGLAAARTVRNASRLGRAVDARDVQTALARGIFRDHVYCLAAMAVVLSLQLYASTR